MKQIKTWAAGLIISTAILAACTKNDMNTNTVPDTAAASAAKTAASQVTYQLAATPMMEDGMLQWNSGYITTSALLYKGLHNDNNTSVSADVNTQNVVTVKLFEAQKLGMISIPVNTYTAGMFSMQLGAANGLPSFALNGTLNYKNAGTPVQIVVTDPLTIASAWTDNVLIAMSQKYTVTLSLSLSNVNANITGDMLARADKTNGVILISSTANTGLYHTIVANIQNQALGVTLSSASTFTNDAAATTMTPAAPATK
jgi:hypothetical protein